MNASASKVTSWDRQDFEMHEYQVLDALMVSTIDGTNKPVMCVNADAIIETLDQTSHKQSLKRRRFLRMRWLAGVNRPDPVIVARVLINEVQVELNRQGLIYERVLGVRFTWTSEIESAWVGAEIGAIGRVIPRHYLIDRSVHRPFWVENLIRHGVLVIEPDFPQSHFHYPESMLRYKATLKGHAATYALEEGDVVVQRADGLLTAHFRSDNSAGTIGN